jgi:hypothetical protein
MPEALLVGAELLVVVDRDVEDDEDREVDEDEVVSALEVVDDDVLLAVVLSSSLPSRSHRATPMAARITTPATIRAIRVFLLPFGS